MWFFIQTAYAQIPQEITLRGLKTTFPKFAAAIVDFFAFGAFYVCGIVFLIGALWMVIRASKPDEAANGKKIMLDALIGFAVILGAYGILRTVLSLLVA